jgi:DNA-binding NarL/FixJ family response regulator
MKRRWPDITLLYDPVEQFIDRQLAGRWPLPVLAMKSSSDRKISSIPSTPLYYEDRLIDAVDRKYSGKYEMVVLYQLLMAGYTHKSIAQKLDKSLRTVERMIKRLKEDMKYEYEPKV